MRDSRPSVHEMLLNVAAQFATRSTCSRGQTGCVIAVEGRVMASGYNGAPAGMPHCDHNVDAWKTALVDDPGCKISVHAEANAVAFAARHGSRLYGATLYTTTTPCLDCAKLIINAGISQVVARKWYRDQAGWKLLDEAGVKLIIWGEDGPPQHAPGCTGDDPYPCTCGASYT